MTALAYAACVILSVFQSSLVKIGGRSKNPAMFNINKAMSASLMFLAVGLIKGFFPINTPTLLFGLAFGGFFSLSMWAGLIALSSGPLALTSTIVSFSLIIPVAYGIIGGESVTWLMLVGFALLACSFVFINYKKSNQKANLKWFIFSLLTLISDGCCAVVKKMHQDVFKECENHYQAEIMFVALSTVSVIFITVYVIRYMKGKQPKNTKIIDWRGIVCGLANGGSSYFSLYLVAVENVSVQAPVLAALTATAALATGKIIFREKLKPLQLIGFVLGVTAVVLLKLKV